MPYIPEKQPHRAYITKKKRRTTESDGFLQSTQWRKIRKLYRSEFPFCQACEYHNRMSEGRMEVDHIVPREQGGHPTDPRNLNTLCRSDHNRKSGKESHDKILVPTMTTADGYLIPAVEKSELWELLL